MCEKIVIEIPDELKGISTVVMDGPFMSFDPLGKTGYAVMGHVDHAIHHWNIGEVAEVPDHIKPYLNKGIIPSADFSFSRGNLFLETGSEFMPMLEKSKHIGSMFTIRTVLPRVDASDTRPTIVNLVDQKIITVYSGKIGNSVKAAQDVVSLIKK